MASLPVPLVVGTATKRAFCGANSIHGIVIAGVVIVAAHATSPLAWVFIFLAAVLGTMNVVGGYVVTDRMLEMFKSDKGKKKEEEAK